MTCISTGLAQESHGGCQTSLVLALQCLDIGYMCKRLICLVWLGAGSDHPTWQALGLTSRVLTVWTSALTDHSSGQVTSRKLPVWIGAGNEHSTGQALWVTSRVLPLGATTRLAGTTYWGVTSRVLPGWISAINDRLGRHWERLAVFF